MPGPAPGTTDELGTVPYVFFFLLHTPVSITTIAAKDHARGSNAKTNPALAAEMAGVGLVSCGPGWMLDPPYGVMDTSKVIRPRPQLPRIRTAGKAGGRYHLSTPRRTRLLQTDRWAIQWGEARHSDPPWYPNCRNQPDRTPR